MIKRWDSVAQIASELLDSSIGRSSESWVSPRDHHDSDWTNGVTSEQACELAYKGDAKMVSSMTKILDKIETGTAERPAFRSIMAPSGGSVSVPRALSGHPNVMRSRTRSESTVRHVNVYVGIVCSFGFSANAMLKRGAYILGLLESLRANRVSCDVYLLAETHGQTDGDLYQVIPIDSRPLDLSVSGFAIAHPAFARAITYPMAYALDGFNGNWPKTHSEPGYVANVRKLLDMSESDVWVQAPYGTSDEVLKDPEAWLQKNLSQAIGVSQ